MRPLRKTIKLPLAGLLFCFFTGFMLVVARSSGANLLYICFGIMLGCLFLSVFLSGQMLRRLNVERHAPDHAAAGQQVIVHYRITNQKRFWPAFAVSITEVNFQGSLLRVPHAGCMHLAPGQTATLPASMVPQRRGMLEFTEVRLSCAFPFGFINRMVYLNDPRKMIVYPRIGILKRQVLQRAREAATMGAVTNASRGGHDEFYGLREYRLGDSVRAIHWKRSARTGELVIRELTSNVTPQLMVVLDLRGWPRIAGGADRAERGIELAAAVIAHAFLENFAVGMVIAGAAAIPPIEPRMGLDQRQRLLATLALLSLDQLESQPAPLSRSLRQSGAQLLIVSLAKTPEFSRPSVGDVTFLPLDDPHCPQWITFPEPSLPQSAIPVDASARTR